MSGHEHDPKWLEEQNDEQHRKETEPLFGTGDVNLNDPERKKDEKETPTDKKDETTTKPKAKKDSNKKKAYGATTTTTTTKTSDEETGLLPAAAADDATPTSEDRAREALQAKPHVPAQNPCLWLFHMLSGCCVVASLCLLATQIIPVVIIPNDQILQRIGVLDLALRVYIALFCICFVLLEIDLFSVPFIRNSSLLQGFFSRGFIYSFVGLIATSEAYELQLSDVVSNSKILGHISWAAIFMRVSAWFMLGCGIAYMLLGMCCLKRIRDRMKEKEKEAWKEYRADLKEWKDLYT